MSSPSSSSGSVLPSLDAKASVGVAPSGGLGATGADLTPHPSRTCKQQPVCASLHSCWGRCGRGSTPGDGGRKCRAEGCLRGRIDGSWAPGLLGRKPTLLKHPSVMSLTCIPRIAESAFQSDDRCAGLGGPLGRDRVEFDRGWTGYCRGRQRSPEFGPNWVDSGLRKLTEFGQCCPNSGQVRANRGRNRSEFRRFRAGVG